MKLEFTMTAKNECTDALDASSSQAGAPPIEGGDTFSGKRLESLRSLAFEAQDEADRCGYLHQLVLWIEGARYFIDLIEHKSSTDPTFRQMIDAPIPTWEQEESGALILLNMDIVNRLCGSFDRVKEALQ